MMSIIDRLAIRPAVIAFDAYGTLFDVHAAVGLIKERIGADAPAFSAHWRNKQLEYSWVLTLAGRYRDFWSLTQDALDHALAVFPSVDPGLRPELLSAYRRLGAYEGVAEVLDRLKGKGFSCCLFSNGEPGMLADAVASAGLGDRLDAILSVDTIRRFKTAPEAYALVTERFGIRPGEALLVSSNRWDVAGAAAIGMPGLWLNRTGQPAEYPGLEPLATITDLGQLA